MRLGRHRPLPHAEALVEPLHVAGAATRSRGRGSTAARCSRTSRRPTRTTPRRPCRSCGAPSSAYKDHPRSRHSLLVFGHGDGGGGPTARDARAAAAHARPRRRAARAALRPPDAFFDDLARRRARPAHGRRRAVLRVPPRHLHVAGGAEARQPARRAGAARRGALDALRGDGRGEARSSTGCGACCCSTSSTTSCPARASPRSTSAPGRTSPRWSRAPRRAAAPRARAGRRRPREHVGGAGAAGGVARPDGRLVHRRAARRAGRAGSCETADDGSRRARARRRRRSSSRTRSCARWSAPDGTLRSLVHLATGREALAAPGNRSSSTRTTRSRGTPGTSTRRTSSTPPRSRPPAERDRRGARRSRCGPRSRSSVAVGARSRLRQVVRLDAGARRLEFHTEVDWQEDHRLLKVAFPFAVHADEATYEVAFGAVRAADALLHRPRPRPLRGPGPPLGRPLRARLRRGAADRLDLRLQRARRHAPALAAARAAAARPGGRPRPPRVRATRSCRTRAAGRTPASSRRRRRSTPACAGRPARRAGAWVTRRARRASCSTRQAGRGRRRRSCSGSTRPHGGRGRRATVRARPAGAAGARARTCSRSRLGDAAVRDGAIVVAFRPWEIVTLLVR